MSYELFGLFVTEMVALEAIFLKIGHFDAIFCILIFGSLSLCKL